MLKCLMLKTKDKRRFFMHENYFNDLVNFSEIMGGEVSLVKVDESVVLNIEELPIAICNKNYISPDNYELVEVRMNRLNRSYKRQQMLHLSREIRDFIKSELLSKKRITHRQVKLRFKNHNLSNARVSNHLRYVCNELKNQHNVQHTKRGEYTLW